MTTVAEIAQVTRGDLIESRHYGSIVVLNPDGEKVFELGSPEQQIFTRSALKPLQLLAMHSAGLALKSDKERAISLASHDGSKEHARIVAQMLSSAGVKLSALLCPPSWPMGTKQALLHASQGGKPESVLHCCSGKHAAMILTCLQNGWDISNYTDFDHPLQLAIKELVQRFTGEVPYISVDGCGAPTLAVSLTGLANAVRRMATSNASSPFAQQRDAHNILRAARANGWIVSGEGNGDTTLITELGVFSKFGAEGSVIVATEAGFVAAVKAFDGSTRPVHIAAVTALEKAGAISSKQLLSVKDKLRLQIKGGDQQVGEIRTAF